MATVSLVLLLLILAFDFQNVLSWWDGKTIDPVRQSSWDFTIIVPLWGDPRYFAERAQLRYYQRQVLVALAVDSQLMWDFSLELQREGWNVLRLDVPDPNPASILKEALPYVRTRYTVRLDADTILARDLPDAIAAVAFSGADLCSTKVEVDSPKTVAGKLQALEYQMAMLSRHFRPWLTSGACFIGKTESLRAIFARHSLWTPGEDIETGRIAHALHMKIRHVDIRVFTDAPATFRALARQRRLWWAGNFRHSWVNLDKNALQLPVWTTYNLLVVWCSVYYKWWTLVDWRTVPTYLPVVFAVYVGVTAITNLQVVSRWMLAFPLYSFAQLVLLPPIGVCTYVVLAWKRRRLGRYAFGYRRQRLVPVPTV